jgi:creatinine amidohydrolase
MLLEEMTWEEIGRCIEAGYVLFIPIGSLEQHGPHLPVATDVFSVLGLAKKLAEEIDIVIAPPMYYTYAKPMRGFPGTVSIEGSTLMLFLCDVVREFVRQGFKRIVFFSGHYENLAFIQEGIQVALEGTTRSTKIIVTTWWDLVPEAVLKEIFDANWQGWGGVHASLAETALAMALNPGHVRVDRIVDDSPEERFPYDVFPIPPQRLPKTGVFSKTTPATAETGAKLRDAVLRAVRALLVREFH